MDELAKTFKDRIIVVTGGLGSIGEEIVNQLLTYGPAQVRIFDNRETELFYAREKYAKHDNVRFLQGDVRDSTRIRRATEGADIIFHAAALKHVMLCEFDPFEAIKTNVLGTQNLVEAALTNDVGKVILISTDKAISPSNVMGATKLLAERLIGSMYFTRGKNRTKFGAVRFGNVLASRGSVLEIWDGQLERGQKITVTDPEMTRFFMSIPQSVKLIFEAAALADSGETFIFKMPSVKVGDLAAAYLEAKGKPATHQTVIGKRPGERMDELLIFGEEQDYLLENDEFFVRLPLVEKSAGLFREFEKKGFRQASIAQFSSSNPSHMLGKEEIGSLLKDIV